MKGMLLILFSLFITGKLCAQDGLIFKNEVVISAIFTDYSLDNYGDSSLLQYNNNQIISSGLTYNIFSPSYEELLKEIQTLLDELGRNRVPTIEGLDIDIAGISEHFNEDLIQNKYGELFLEPDSEDCSFILEKYRSLDMLTSWLQKAYPIIDSGVFVINTAHDSRGIKIVVRTDMRTYYFDMRDIELFQPYLMRTSDKDCLKFITNFNVNKHLRNLFRVLNIHRGIPWKDEVIESYIFFCAKDYRL